MKPPEEESRFMQIQFFADSSKAHDVLILPVLSGQSFGAGGREKDKAASSRFFTILSKNPDFKAERGQTLLVDLTDDAVPYRAVLYVGLGDGGSLSNAQIEEIAGKAYAAAKKEHKSAAILACDLTAKASECGEAAACFANAMRLRSYSFTKYKTKNPDPKGLEAIAVLCGEGLKSAQAAYKPMESVTNGVIDARNLVSEPPNVINPVTYAKLVKNLFKGLDVKIKVLDDKKMAKMGMEAIVAVGKGSATPSRMVLIEYNGLGKASKTPSVAFVGKGVTFDTGGISIKPAAGMEDMKFDMAGSAAVVGAMKALAGRGARVHAVGAIGLAENLLSERSYRPSDILKSYSGQTIEVMNTDAEGRLVLADTLTYVQREYKPKTVIDLATLTGAMMVALGHEFAGTFATGKELYDALERAGTAVDEDVWRMPLHKEFDKQIASPIADMRNLGASRYAGACTAAAFLQRFIEGDTEWAHIDIAGTAWIKADKNVVPKGATGFGVRLLDRFVRDRYES